MDPTQKFEDDLKELGLEIQILDEKLKSLIIEQKEIDQVIKELKDTVAKNHTLHGSIIGHVPNEVTEEETVQQILKHNSAAAILYEVAQKAPGTLKDCGVVGIVATLGKVEDGNISRLLSEYLGTKNMLAVVCDTLKNATLMESRNKDGSIIKDSGIHGLGEAIRRTIDGRFQVICLETLRPYDGMCVTHDPEWRLNIPYPRLATGEIPHGFLGYAVNMISIDHGHLFTPAGPDLRKTLFYHLFSRLQVYKTEKDMVRARLCITDGALSLDGGLIRSAGDFCFGNMEEALVKFPRSSEASYPPAEYYIKKDQVKHIEWKKELLVERIQRQKFLLHQAKFKKQKLLQVIAQSSNCV